MNKLLILLIFLFHLFGCGTPTAVAKEGEVLSSKNIADGVYQIDLSLDSGVIIKNIFYKKRKIGNDWILEIKFASGFKVLRSSNENKLERSITNEEYLDMLEILMKYFVNNRGDFNFDSLHLDIRLVEDTWIKIVSAIQNVVVSKNGKITNKDKEVTKVLVDVLRFSKQVIDTCRTIERYQFKCKGNIVSINPIAFKPEYVGSKWVQLSNIKDAGIHPSTWYSIKLEKD